MFSAISDAIPRFGGEGSVGKIESEDMNKAMLMMNETVHDKLNELSKFIGEKINDIKFGNLEPKEDMNKSIAEVSAAIRPIIQAFIKANGRDKLGVNLCQDKHGRFNWLCSEHSLQSSSLSTSTQRAEPLTPAVSSPISTFPSYISGIQINNDRNTNLRITRKPS
jgi:hypothetical protein